MPPAKTKRAPRRVSAPKTSGPPVAVPDVIGDVGRAKIVAELLSSMQRDRAHIEAMRIANDADWSAPCPAPAELGGGVFRSEDGTPISYRERCDQLERGERRIGEEYKHLMAEVRRLLGQAEEGEE